MQHDVDTVATGVPIEILGVNEKSMASGNATFIDGRTLPWLQDTDAANAWVSWQADWRDVIVLDDENKVVRIYNLFVHNLADSAGYAELRNTLLDAAGPPAISVTARRR